MSQHVFDKIVALLEKESAKYEVLEHEAEGKCDMASKIRGNKLEEANKALIVRIKRSNSEKKYVLLALRADQKADFAKLDDSAADIRLCEPSKVLELCDCEVGAVPPFSFSDQLKVIADPLFLENKTFWFNAGLLNKSIKLNSRDYIRIVKPEIRRIAEDPQVIGY